MRFLTNNNTTMKLALTPILSILILLWLSASVSGAVPTTRQQTILPIAITPGTEQVAPSNVPLYAVYGYSAWQVGAGTNEGRKLNLMPDGYKGTGNAARLLSFFSISDIHITDKESPVGVTYLGWSAAFLDDGLGGLNHAAYSPVMFATTHRLDAAIKTINALHQTTPFNFGISLGDDANCSQYNELRWFIDVMDGQAITPSSGAHLGATTIDYQMPFQATGLDRSIPWYNTIGNHDQMWMGIGYPASAKLQAAFIGSNVLNIATNGPLVTGSEGAGMYVGVVDGTTPYGAVIKWGLTNLYDTPPTVAADTNRRSLSVDLSSPTNYINEFFNTLSSPRGHGFNLANTGSLAACYTFEPLTNMPIKIIVLDDTCKSNAPGQNPMFYGAGWMDAVRLAWLTNELQKGQDADQLMIIATHIPILPQENLFITNTTTMFYDTQVESNLVATLHNYPNLLMVMAGHRHVNVVTPFPSPDPARPECGFWEVETPSLRDFPQQFRTWDIRRNIDNTISILTTSVDPQVETNSPAGKSLGYGIGAERIFGNISLTDTTSHTYNAELIKMLTPAMQAKIANYGAPLYNRGHDYDGDGKADATIYRSSDGLWQVALSGLDYQQCLAVETGLAELTPVAGDYDGDGYTDMAVYNRLNGRWQVRYTSSGLVGECWLGGPDFTAAQCDFDGDAKIDPVAYRAADGYWEGLASARNYGLFYAYLGEPGDQPVAADYDGDRLADPAVYNQVTGLWVIYSSKNIGQIMTRIFGGNGYLPVSADYDGDGLADPAVYAPSTAEWQAWLSGSLATQGCYTWWGGVFGDINGTPVPADYDGDGKTDPAVYYHATSLWEIFRSTRSYQSVIWGPFGNHDFIPVQ